MYKGLIRQHVGYGHKLVLCLLFLLPAYLLIIIFFASVTLWKMSQINPKSNDRIYYTVYKHLFNVT